MSALSVSFHVGCKGHSVSTRKELSARAKHIMMKWKKDPDKRIVPLFDYDTNILQAVENLYHDEFDEAVINYNAKQKREDRKIQSYSDKVDADGKTDYATEVILQVGDKDFWAQYDIDTQVEIMKSFYEEMIEELKRVCPDFKIANATLHAGEKTFDENGNFLHYGSPHVHIIGIPVGRDYEKGLSKRVSKKKVFTADTKENGGKGTLSKIQDALHKKASEILQSRNSDLEIKRKDKGRPFYLDVDDYKEAKDKERLQQENDKLRQENNDLIDDYNNMVDILDSVYDHVGISKVEKDNIESIEELLQKLDDWKKPEEIIEPKYTDEDYEALKKDYDDLKQNYDNVVNANNSLQEENKALKKNVFVKPKNSEEDNKRQIKSVLDYADGLAVEPEILEDAKDDEGMPY